MTYIPKKGDLVTSPLLVGTWEVIVEDPATAIVKRGSTRAQVSYTDLISVAPPLPPEPAVGEVVWAQGRYWVRNVTGWHSHKTDKGAEFSAGGWSDIAADAEPVVRVSQVADWLPDDLAVDLVSAFRAEFGWGNG